MKIDQVRSLPPEQRLKYWICERQSIKMLKDLRSPPPWTNDEILQTYRFCNVRRMDDKVSRWLWAHWYKPNKNHPNMLTAVTLARQLNNPDSLEEIGFPTLWEPGRVLDILNKRTSQGKKNFSAAYMITGTLGGTKAEQIVNKVVDVIYRAQVPVLTNTMQEMAESLLPYPGFSTFIAGQVTADLRHSVTGRWRDKSIWAPYGPGSLRGMNRLRGRQPDSALAKRNWVLEFRLYLDWFYSQIQRTDLEAIDAQNCLCEFDKYERALWGEGRPKQYYKGASV